MICWKKEGQGPEDILLKIVPLVCMLPYLLKTILTARFLYRIFWLLCRAAWDSGLLLAIVNLVLAASTMLSCGLCTVMLLRFSVRRTKEDVGSLYLWSSVRRLCGSSSPPSSCSGMGSVW